MKSKTRTSGPALCVAFLLLTSAVAQVVSGQIPDPAAPGPLAVTRAEYNFGDTAFTPTNFPGPVELLASVHYPTNLSGGRGAGGAGRTAVTPAGAAPSARTAAPERPGAPASSARRSSSCTGVTPRALRAELHFYSGPVRWLEASPSPVTKDMITLQRSSPVTDTSLSRSAPMELTPKTIKFAISARWRERN